MQHCALMDIEMQTEVSEHARKILEGAIAPAEDAFLQSLTADQKAIWLDLESVIFQEMNLVQELTIKKFRCPICPAKVSCTNHLQ